MIGTPRTRGARAGRAPLWSWILFALCGCNTGLGVELVEPLETRDALARGALDEPAPSARTRALLRAQVGVDLEQVGLREAIRRLHASAAARPQRVSVFALAELAYALARESDARADHLAAAAYAYAYLFGEQPAEPPSPYDARFAQACELYNRSLLQAFRSEEREWVPESGRFALPVGELQLRLASETGTALRYVLADGLELRGFDSRPRSSGLGVALIESTDWRPATRGAGTPSIDAPRSGFLRFEGGLIAMQEHRLSASLEIHRGPEWSVRVGASRVPLESDLAAPIASELDGVSLPRMGFERFIDGRDAAGLNTLFRAGPVEEGKLPVVFIHGTSSSPAAWAGMVLALMEDPELRAGIQPWFFRYVTGMPVTYSATFLRDSLRAQLAELDPQGERPELRSVVVVGHSQGGLLAKLMVVGSDASWWEEMLGQPLDELELEPELAELVQRMTDFEPVERVGRAVYVSTPHRGSFLAEGPLARWASGFVSLPQDVAGALVSLLSTAPALEGQERATAIQSMHPRSRLLELLVRAHPEPHVRTHSIISVRGGPPWEEGNDGIVSYTSAHLEDVDSELVVQSGHSCLDRPATIAEVRRILLEALDELEAERAPSSRP